MSTTEDVLCERTYVEFIVAGKNLDPSMVTRFVGLEPSLAIRPGEVRPHRSRVEPMGRWEIHSRHLVATGTEPHFDHVLSRLEASTADMSGLKNLEGVERVFFSVYWLAAL